MATNFITSHGMIWGEISDTGVTRSYGHDALGSVTETFVNGALENTYRYKPFGGLLAKTGTAPDPSFLWNGGSGYRTTLLSYCETYVRRRHFSISSANWTTSDPLWPSENAYGYVRQSPVLLVDASGLSYGCKIDSFPPPQPSTPSCNAKVDSKTGLVSLSVYKNARTYCQGECTEPRKLFGGCGITQTTSVSSFMTSNGTTKPLNGTGGEVQDDEVQCMIKQYVNDNTSTWIMEMSDAPGWWDNSAIAGKTPPCPPVSGIHFKPFAYPGYSWNIPPTPAKLDVYMHFRTFCCCWPVVIGGYACKEQDWDFNWSVTISGTASSPIIQWGGECPH